MRAGVAGLVIVSLLAAGGTGFAALSSSGIVTTNAYSGSVGPLVWGTGSSLHYGPGLDSPYAVCTATVGPTGVNDVLTISATGLTPQGSCVYLDSLKNLGSLPAVPSEAMSSTTGTLCSVLLYDDDLFVAPILIGSGGQTAGPSSLLTIHAGSSVPWAILLEMAGPGTGSCSFSVTITGTAP